MREMWGTLQDARASWLPAAPAPDLAVNAHASIRWLLSPRPGPGPGPQAPKDAWLGRHRRWGDTCHSARTDLLAGRQPSLVPRLGAQRTFSQVFALAAQPGPAKLCAPGPSEQLPQSLWVKTGQAALRTHPRRRLGRGEPRAARSLC